jgi:microcystin-dependent protein
VALCTCLTSIPAKCPTCGNDNPPCVTAVNGSRGDVTVEGTGESSQAWPVGSVFIALVSTNPGTLLGYGTWAAVGAGRVLVGLDATQAEFDTVRETGGAKTHTLTEAQMPPHTHVQNAHTHVQNSHTHIQDAHTHTLPVGATDDTAAPFDRADAGTNASGANATTASGSTTATNQATTAVNQNATAVNQNTGGGQSFSLMNPYLVAYFWERTA